jgi:hypothetical protein
VFEFTFTWLKFFGIIVIIISVLFDEIRDAYWNVTNFWKSHIPKWISMFSLWIFTLIVIKLEWWLCIILTVCCHYIWHYSADYIVYMPSAGSLWKKLWKLIIKIYEKIKGDKQT